MDRPSQADSPADLHAQQVHVLYRNMPTGVFASAANAVILAAVEWAVAAYAAGSLGSRPVVHRCRPGAPDCSVSPRGSAPLKSPDWYRWMLVSTTGAGVAWGSSIYFLAPEIPLPYELVHLFVLGA